MGIFEMIKQHGTGKGEEVMWRSVRHISDFIESVTDKFPEEVEKLKVEIFTDLADGHFNKEFAEEKIRKMYYKDDNGNKHYAPYWTDEDMDKACKAARAAIPSCYNEWDFRVTMNMIASDNHNMLDEWFPDASDEELTSKIIDMAINFLDDEDAPHPKTKIWNYFF